MAGAFLSALLQSRKWLSKKGLNEGVVVITIMMANRLAAVPFRLRARAATAFGNPLMKKILTIVALTGGLLCHSASGGLIHAYHFRPDAPLADAVGGAELTMVEDVTFAPEGYATFDGEGGLSQKYSINHHGEDAIEVFLTTLCRRECDFSPAREIRSTMG